jgi:hypothetical protein
MRKEKKETAEEDERRGREQATTQGVTPGRLRGRISEGVTLKLLTPPLHRKV